MRTIYFTSESTIKGYSLDVIRGACEFVTPDEIEFEPEAEPGEHTLNFGGTSELGTHTLSPREMALYPNGASIVAAGIASHLGILQSTYTNPFESQGVPDHKVLYMDIEAHGVEHMWNMEPEDYFRLGQFGWGSRGAVELIESYEEFMDTVSEAQGLVAHYGHNFDWSVLYGKKSVVPLHLAMENRLFDTKTFASVLFPAPPTYRDRKGRWHAEADKPDNASHGWLSLDNLAFQFGIPGKEGDLHALAKEFGGFGAIPVSDARYRRYAEQDVQTLQLLTSALTYVDKPGEYDWREQLNAAIDAQNSRNGFYVDLDLAQARQDMLQTRKDELLGALVEQYGFPTTGKKPWMSKVGKQAIFALLKDHGIDPHEDPEWPKSEKTGAPSLGGEVLIAGTEGTEAEETGRRLAELQGQRSLAELAIATRHEDGFVHPNITTYQRSGRKSTTKPGLTVWTSKGPGAVEKSYFIAREGHSLVEFDYSQADARIVAAYSGDMEYAKLFAPGADMHETRSRRVFGDLTYDSNPTKYRNAIKPINHGGNYGLGEEKLARMLRISILAARDILDRDKAAYRIAEEWKEQVRREAKSGWVTNAWGRRMPISPGRGYTQAPALYGQSGTREIMVDALIRMLRYDIRIILWLKAQVHDALVFEIPDEHLDWAVPKIQELMATNFMGIDFIAAHGHPAHNWQEAAHG